MSGPSLFDQARGAGRIEDFAGVALKRAGRELRGPCPFCGAGVKSKSGPFAVNVERQTFRCFCGCPQHGDVVDLVAAQRVESLAQAARWIIGGASGPIAPAVRARPEKPQGPSAAQRIGAEMWASARDLTGSLGERYLIGRGVLPTVVALASAKLRFHPFAKAGWDERSGDWVKAPAILVQVVVPDADGVPTPTGGIHATYLKRDGSGRDKALGKKMWGPQGLDLPPDNDGVIRRVTGGAWLIGPGPCVAGILDSSVGGEGIETSLSIASLSLMRGRHVRAWAALSLDRLQGGELVDADGARDLEHPRPDPAVPPFVWPGQDRVLIGVDRDMSPIRVKGRTGRGKICMFEVDAEARARRCGQLAVAGWLAAGAREARAIAPPPGLDFNDELRRVLALEGQA
jgi:hypothetical protein